jgi:hypothetical protein
MATGSPHDFGLWRRRGLTIPPNSLRAWVQLALWEIWMGMLVAVILGFGITLIVTSPNRIVTISDLTSCYGPPPVALPCERIVYRGGLLNLAFTALFGTMLIGVAAWFLWELWSAVEPKPITDDFLKLLDDSFGRDWRNPLTWPWARVLWAYGFAAVGGVLVAGVALALWTSIASSHSPHPSTPRVETSQSFRVGQ